MFCISDICKAQILLPTIIQDSTLSQQFHVNVSCSYNEFYMKDSTCQVTVMYSGGLTGWVKLTAWLYGKDGAREDKYEFDYYLKDTDYTYFWLYGLPYGYKYVCDKLGLTIQE